MSLHFSRSLRKLEADASLRSGLIVVIGGALAAIWLVWLLTARVAIYATTATARLEVDRENRPVDAPVDGRVVVEHLTAGTRVEAGDVLLELEAEHERLAHNEVLAKLAPGSVQLKSLWEELAAETGALEGERRGSQAAGIEASAKAQESATVSELASDEARRLFGLQERGLVSELDALRGRKLAEERQSQARAAEFAARRQHEDLDTREQERLGRMARLRNEIAAIEGSLAEARAVSERLEYQIQQRFVKAPISGTLAESAPLKAGATVKMGARICTIVPDGGLKVVALFTPSTALGRVREGQLARVRLDGFPWTQFGSTPARVSGVATEVRDGQIRVELTLTDHSDGRIPLQHGLPAEVDVELEHISPLAMVLRTAGGHMRVNAADPSLAQTPH